MSFQFFLLSKSFEIALVFLRFVAGKATETLVIEGNEFFLLGRRGRFKRLIASMGRGASFLHAKNYNIISIDKYAITTTGSKKSAKCLLSFQSEGLCSFL